MSKETVSNIFDSTLDPRDVTKYTLMRGVTDFTNLQQFDLYETGNSFLICLDIPKFLTALRSRNNTYDTLIRNYRHILEYEFRGAQGIEDISAETNQLTNGITDLNIITKTTEQGGTSFSMNYYERSGSLITKVNELFIRGVKDPRTQFKRYNGLLKYPEYTGKDNAGLTKGYQSEIFHFLLIVTDNTGLNVEKAYILASCQPNVANTSIYNVTRGEINFSEIALQFNGFPIPGRIVNQRAVEFLDFINKHTCFDEMEFGYNILNKSLHPEAAVEVYAGSSDATVADSPTYDSIVNLKSTI